MQRNNNTEQTQVDWRLALADNAERHLVRAILLYIPALITAVCVPRCLIAQALTLMKEKGVPPSTYTMNSLMGVSVQARQPNTALEVFRDMEREGVKRDVVRLDGNLRACVYCVLILVLTSRVHKVHEMFVPSKFGKKWTNGIDRRSVRIAAWWIMLLCSRNTTHLCKLIL